MTNRKDPELSFLRSAYLNGSVLAIFEALNKCMEHIPYDLDLVEDDQSYLIPSWLLQAFREMVVFRIESKKDKKSGPEENLRLKFLTALAKEMAEHDKKLDPNVKLYERAQDHLIEMGEGLQPETIKKYAAIFNGNEKKLSDLGKNFILNEVDQKIYNDVQGCMNYY